MSIREVKMSEEELSKVAGGIIVGMPDHKFNVIDEKTGTVIAVCNSRTEALKCAQEHGVSTHEYTAMETADAK